MAAAVTRGQRRHGRFARGAGRPARLPAGLGLRRGPAGGGRDGPTSGGRGPWRRPAAAALQGAGVGVDDVAHFDLYSCFTSSIEFALDALGIEPAPAAQLGARDAARPPGHGDRRPRLPRRPGQQLHDPLARHHGRAAAAPTRAARDGQRRGHAHEQARLRRLLDRAGAAGPARRRARWRPQAAMDEAPIVESFEGPATGGHLLGGPRARRRARVGRPGL